MKSSAVPQWAYIGICGLAGVGYMAPTRVGFEWCDWILLGVAGISAFCFAVFLRHKS